LFVFFLEMEPPLLNARLLLFSFWIQKSHYLIQAGIELFLLQCL
jgi:hypothetical protein